MLTLIWKSEKRKKPDQNQPAKPNNRKSLQTGGKKEQSMGEKESYKKRQIYIPLQQLRPAQAKPAIIAQ